MMYVSILKLSQELLKISVDLLPTDPITKNVLKALIDSVSEQTANMDQKLDQLLAAPYKNGLSLLASADLLSDPALRQQNISNALGQFVDASSKAVTAPTKAQALFYAGVCYTLLNEPKAALAEYEDAYKTAWNYRLEIVESLDNSWRFIASLAMANAYRSFLYALPRRDTVKQIKAMSQYNRLRRELVSLDQNLLIPIKVLLQSKSSSLPLLQEHFESWELDSIKEFGQGKSQE